MQTLLAEIEEDYGLQEVLGHSVMVPPLRPAEIERQPELKRPAPRPAELEPPAHPTARPTREEIRVMCEASAVDCHSFTEYASRLAIVGVEIIPTVQQQGAQLTGLSYCLDGETMKGSDVGKAYAAAGIQARGSAMSKTATMSQWNTTAPAPSSAGISRRLAAWRPAPPRRPERWSTP